LLLSYFPDLSAVDAGGSAREEYEPEDVEFYFNYMGCLATEVGAQPAYTTLIFSHIH
jgi:hypothetical protein